MSLRTILSSTAAQAAAAAAAETQTTGPAKATSAKSHGHTPANPATGLVAVPTPSQVKRTAMPSSARSAPAAASGGAAASGSGSSGGTKGTRDTRRRATHSQIERRRREKINTRLITLRNLVPACVAQLAEKNRGRLPASASAGSMQADDEGEADGAPEDADDADEWVPGGRRKRKRRKAELPKPPVPDSAQDEELGLHKLDVLTHTIDYIYELQARLEELETGHRPVVFKTADADADDEDGSSPPLPVAPTSAKRARPAARAPAPPPAPKSSPTVSLPSPALVPTRSHPQSSDEETVSDGMALSDMELDVASPPFPQQHAPHGTALYSSGATSARGLARPQQSYVQPPRHSIRVPRRGAAASSASASASSEEPSPPTSGSGLPSYASSSASGASTCGPATGSGGIGPYLSQHQQPSPMILPLGAGSLTTSMMSLSAGSPIMQSSVGGEAKRKASLAAIAGARGAPWPTLPPPMVGAAGPDSARRASAQQHEAPLPVSSVREAAILSDSRTVLPGSPQPQGPQPPPASPEESPRSRRHLHGGPDPSDAQLLLSISTSPEALRPQTVLSASSPAGLLFRQQQAQAQSQAHSRPPPFTAATHRAGSYSGASTVPYGAAVPGYATPQAFLATGGRSTSYGPAFAHGYTVSSSSGRADGFYASAAAPGMPPSPASRPLAYPASAPGGARAQRSGSIAYAGAGDSGSAAGAGLASPPLLALDDAKHSPPEDGRSETAAHHQQQMPAQQVQRQDDADAMNED